MLIAQALIQIFRQLPGYSGNMEVERIIEEFITVFPKKTFSATTAERVYLELPNAQRFPKQIELPAFLASLSRGLADLAADMEERDVYTFMLFTLQYLAEMYPEIPVKKIILSAFTAALNETFPELADLRKMLDDFARFRLSNN